MATYVIGDVQGCFSSLRALLKAIDYAPTRDTLWFAGDCVNRGPDSLAVLRFIRQCPHARLVLGNHDLHFLAVYYTQKTQSPTDTLAPLLAAPDVAALAHWLCQQPLLLVDDACKAVMVHAGIYPAWSLDQARGHAREVEAVLQSAARDDFLHHMYGDEPRVWSSALSGIARYRFITNVFTRMRCVDANGGLDLQFTGAQDAIPSHLTPWFAAPRPQSLGYSLCFGHWAALAGKCAVEDHYALDGGCVWGQRLMALRLDDKQRFSVACAHN